MHSGWCPYVQRSFWGTSFYRSSNSAFNSLTKTHCTNGSNTENEIKTNVKSKYSATKIKRETLHSTKRQSSSTTRHMGERVRAAKVRSFQNGNLHFNRFQSETKRSTRKHTNPFLHMHIHRVHRER